MYRPLTHAAAIVVCALGPGCLYYEDPDDPTERARRDAQAAERGLLRRGRRRTWFLVKTWVREVPVDAPLAEGASPAIRQSVRQRANAAGLHLVLRDPPKERHSSILLQEKQPGFVALARGEPVRRFDLDGKSYAPGDVAVDRGFEIEAGYPSSSPPGWTLRFAPVFRSLAQGGGDLRAPGLSFHLVLGATETLVVDASPDAADPVVRALFLDVPEERKRPTRRRLYIQVEAFR